MKTSLQLTDADRAFFELVAQAAFANPFSEERRKIDRQLAEDDAGAKNKADRLQQVIRNLNERIARLESEKRATLGHYEGAERELMRTVFLFEAYHRYYEAFIRLILDQLQAGDDPCSVPFAAEVLALLTRRGFTQTDAGRYLAIFYQLRRAFYFIDRDLIGRSACMRELRSRLWSNVFTHDVLLYERYLWTRMEDFSTLLLGETGTGKGAAAAAIGRSGFIPFDPRAGRFVESFTRTFVALNLSQYPATLIESELFGHKKGAFTGAIEPHEGVFARCSPHGAIFLDEIGDVSIPIQIKLLQVLQERTFAPVGSHTRRRFAGRTIAATNKPLDELRRSGAFRDDFYYRLCSDVIVLPPLRQRLEEEPDELGDLVRHLLRRLVGEQAEALAPDIVRALADSPGRGYAWPGNVRELEQAVRRILLSRRYEGDRAPAADDPFARLAAGMDAETLDAERLLAGYCALLYRRHGTYEAVARLTGLDRRTARKYVHAKAAVADGD